MFCMRVITSVALGKFLGSCVDLPSMEVQLKRVFKRSFFSFNDLPVDLTNSLPSGNCFFFSLEWVGGSRRQGPGKRRGGAPCVTTELLLRYGSYWRSRDGLGIGSYQGLLHPNSTRFFPSLVISFRLTFRLPASYSARRIEVEAFPLPS